MEIGKIDEFTIISETDSGHYIRPTESSDDPHEDIFMPYLRNDISRSKALTLNQTIDAFIYQNDEGAITASLLLPYAEVEEFAVLKVVGSRDFGAFLDWGLEKDLLVPAKKQKTPMKEGEFHLVRICFDADSGKIYGTTKYVSFLETLDIYFKEGEKIEIIPAEEHELGFRCIINRKFIGMIYHNEIFVDIELDKEYEGYVKKIREDGQVDAVLQEQGIKSLNESRVKILKLLKDNNGKLDLHDKSSPDEIKQKLGMSKKTFKNSIGILYKAKQITISKSGIELVKKP